MTVFFNMVGVLTVMGDLRRAGTGKNSVFSHRQGKRVKTIRMDR